MTEERLTELCSLWRTIEELRKNIEDVQRYEFLSIYGGYHGDSNKDWIFNSDDSGCSGLRECIVEHLKKRLEEAEKKFEEA